MKKDRNCGAVPYPIYPTYQGMMPNMPGQMPAMPGPIMPIGSNQMPMATTMVIKQVPIVLNNNYLI